jgi:co-chaperonin GroES (HSP10)
MKIKEVKPHGVHLVAEVTILPEESEGVYTGPAKQSTKTEIEYYYGKAISLGDGCSGKDQCPELNEGDGLVFSQFAGHHTKTEDGFCKVVRGHDIVAILDDMKNINENTIRPTGDRILVEIINESVIDENGIFNDSKPDPRQLATQMGRVISCAKNAHQFETGEVVAFEPYVGNLIVNEPGKKLKTVNSFDIIFSVK